MSVCALSPGGAFVGAATLDCDVAIVKKSNSFGVVWIHEKLRASALSETTDRRSGELQIWAVREGLRGTPAPLLFEGFCRRLVAAGVPLWRAFAGIRTLHPQWAGYTYTLWRDPDNF